MQILRNTNFNFIRWRWHAIVVSAAIIAAGAWFNFARGGLPLGIDFTGGTVMVLQFAQPTSEDVVRKALDPVTTDKVVQKYGQAGQNQILVRLPMMKGQEEGTNLEAGVNQVQDALQRANVGSFQVVSKDLVGPVVGADLRNKGIYATLAAMLGIMLYIALRFRLTFGVGASVASLHDVLITLSLLTFFGYELSLNVIAAILTLVGYGVNEQIVVFDRVRENLRTSRGESMDTVINRSVNQTLPRTIITCSVTFLAVFALYLFGGEVLRAFSFTMLVGIATSTLSTVYIASGVATLLSPRRTAAARAVDAKTARRAGQAR
ncbi:MAG TPA: protein translocase subunit SecF [Vicinamibacterales bacterium]|nr:protein translocase subunit SecF [Vicinamibacterales bacterium]